MKAIYRMNCDCGRSGDLQGVFVAEKELIDFLVDNEISVYFGEVLGKHSEIYGTISENEFEMISDKPEEIEFFERLKLQSGYNPLKYSCMDCDRDEFDVDDCETVEELIKAAMSKKV